MAKKGPKPKSQASKARRGNPGKRGEDLATRRAGGAVATSTGGVLLKRPPQPRWLNQHQKREWKRLLDHLMEIKSVAAVDIHLLEVYMATWESHRLALEAIKRHGVVLEYYALNSDGKPVKPLRIRAIEKNPAVTVRENAGKELRQLLAHFGLTPIDRERVSKLASEAEVQEDDEVAQWRAKRG